MTSRSHIDWSPDELVALHTLYPRATKPEVMAEIPGRSWIAISRRAWLRKIRRMIGRPAFKLRSEIPSTVASLRDRRLARRLSMKALARMIPCHRDALYRWENGETSPKLSQFEAWVRALGAEVRIAAAADGVQEPWQGITAPTREQLMGRRAA